METKISEEIYNKLLEARNIAPINPESSIRISKEMYELASLNNLGLEKGYALLNISFAGRVKSDTKSMLENSYKALSIFQDESEIIGQIKSLNLIGISYFYSSMYDEALDNFVEAKELLKLHKDDSLLTRILNNIGEVYREAEIYSKAIEYYDMAIKIVSKDKNLVNHAVILLNIGEIYFIEKEFDKALEEFSKSYNILLETNELVFLADTENKIGKIYFETKDFKNAKTYYMKAIKRLERVENKYYSIEVLINLADVYEVESIDKTLEFYEKAMYLAEGIDSKKKLCDIYLLLSKYYEREEDYKNAFLYYKKHSHLNEELINSSLKNKLEILNIEFNNINKSVNVYDIKIRLEKEIERQKEEIDRIKLSNDILEKKVYQDELTGVSNRRSINIYLKEMLNKIIINDKKILLFMIDIDKFKSYNDYWGHVEGDICLKRIASCIKSIQIRYGDFFGRYGGEEFVYVSTSKSYNEALKLGNLIRKEVEKLGIFYIDSDERKATTISLGGVIGNFSDITSSREILELADKELYKAKNKGRNMIVLKEIVRT